MTWFLSFPYVAYFAKTGPGTVNVRLLSAAVPLLPAVGPPIPASICLIS